MHSPDGKKRGVADAAKLGGPLVMQALGLSLRSRPIGARVSRGRSRSAAYPRGSSRQKKSCSPAPRNLLREKIRKVAQWQN